MKRKIILSLRYDGFTWDEFDAVCQQLMDNKETLGIKHATLINDYGIKTILPYMWQNGVEYTNEDETKCNHSFT